MLARNLHGSDLGAVAEPDRRPRRRRACRARAQSAEVERHPNDQQRAVGGALSEVGWVAEVLVNQTTGHVVDGHLRIELALARKEPTVPVTYVELTVDEERIVLATLDPLAAMADAETEALAQLLAGLEPADEALRELLDDLARQHGIDGLQAGLADPDDVPEVPEQPYVKPGELYLLGDHRLLCGDATKADDVARLLDGGEPTLLATDPPYGVSLDPTWRDGVYIGLGPVFFFKQKTAYEIGQ